jgi:hypothetical protein
MKKVEKARRLQHSANQNKYAANKKKTHQMIHRWVPKDRVVEFNAAFSRMEKKWLKSSGG